MARKSGSAPAQGRLDRLAARLGVPQARDGAWRTFALGTGPDSRAIRYKQQGKGSFVIESHTVEAGEWTLDASTVGGEDRIERLLIRATRLAKAH